MPVSELEKKADMKIRAARTENKRPSGASFKSDGIPVRLQNGYLEEKGLCRQVLSRRVIQPFQARWSTSSRTSLEPKKANMSNAKPASVRRTAVWLRQPSW